MSIYDNMTKQLIIDEGTSHTAYKDTLGMLTIGVGRLIDPVVPGSGLRDNEIAFMLQNDINDRYSALSRKLPFFQGLDEARQGVLINMSFQMGVTGLLGFKNTLDMIRCGEYAQAADNMLKSKWATQTPKRAHRMADQMRTGIWQFDE